MSDNLAVAPKRPALPPRPRPQAATPTMAAEWKANFFRVRGWKSNAAKHQELKSALDDAASKLLKPGSPDSAAALTSAKLDPGTDFKAYLKALAAFEQAPDGKAASALKAASMNYIAHYDKHSDREKKQKNTRRKYEVCRRTLTDVDLWWSLQTIPAPPWDSKTAMKAASTKAEVDFASLPIGQQTAESLGDAGGVNSSFWVNQAGSDPSKPAKTYLFKPATQNKIDRQGVPDGGEPAREALTGRAADILNGMVGIDFKVPETHIVKVERKRFDGIAFDSTVKDHGKTGPLVGSLQQFAKSEGELRDNAPALARAVPPGRCQELAILDIITMHMDRHSGNLMVKGDAAGADLVPIDNGLSFPNTPDMVSFMASSHNALLRLPGSHKPFTPEMLQKLAKINPADLKRALKSEIGDIESVEASAKGKVTDAALEQSRRAAMFLKLAAPTLSPAMVQVALGQNAHRLFDPQITTDAAFAQVAGPIIAGIAPDRTELAEYFQMSMDEQLRVEQECEDLGWNTALLSPTQMLKVFKSKARMPAVATLPNLLTDSPAPPPATDQEKSGLQLAFPDTPIKQLLEGECLIAWRTLSQTYTPAQIKDARERASAKLMSGPHKLPPLLYPENLFPVLQMQGAADALPRVGAAAGKTILLDSKRDLIKALMAMLPDQDQARASQRPDILRAANDEDGLNQFRDEIAGQVRQELLAQHEALSARANGLVDERAKRLRLEQLKGCEKNIRIDVNLFRAKAILDDVRSKLP